MKIEYSLTTNPTEHFTIENVTSYTYTDKECFILTAKGLAAMLVEAEIEDFSVSLLP